MTVGNIGEKPFKKVELEPMPEHAPVEEPAVAPAIPAPAVPVPEPEKVPA
jgi:hypothetical protein